MEMNFCRRCGSPLTAGSEESYHCSNGHTLYANPAPAVGIFFVTPDNQVLLAVRGIEPFKGKLDAIGGFVDIDETFEQAVKREVLEELGLSPDQYDEPEYLYSGTGPYPYDGEERMIIGTMFWSRLKPGVVPTPNDDVAGIQYVSLDSFDFSEVRNTDAQSGLRKLQQRLFQ